MATRSITDQVQALLSRGFAEAKVRGTPSPDVESTAVFEAIALSLLTSPRATYYIALLARNSLNAAILDELTALSILRATVVDLANPAYKIQSTKHLEVAKTALLQIEGLQKVDSTSSSFNRFSTAIDGFLKKTLGTTVRRPGATSLTRPGDEAALDIVSDFETVKALHSKVLDKLYALSTGIDNFKNTPLRTILSLATISRARTDIQDIIDNILDDSSSQNARDYVTRLITSRAALKVIGNPPKFGDPVIDSVSKLPLGYSLKGRTTLGQPSVTSIQGPFSTVGASISVTVTTPTGSLTDTSIFQPFVDTRNKPYLVSPAITFPITLPAHAALYFKFGTGVIVEAIINNTGSPASYTLGNITSAINAAFGSAGVGALATEYMYAGSSRLLIYGPNATTMMLTSYFQDPLDLSIRQNSCHSNLGFIADIVANPGVLTPEIVQDYFNHVFASYLTATVVNQSVVLTSLDSSAGTVMTINAPSYLGISGTFTPQSTALTLYGTVPTGDVQDPVNPIGLLDIGDRVTMGSTVTTVKALSAAEVELANAVPTYDGNVTVTSSLDIAYPTLKANIDSFLKTWLKGPYAEDLKTIDFALATLLGGSTAAERNNTLVIIDDLVSKLTSLSATIMDTGAQLPTNGANTEAKIVKGIINTLTERKYDRARDLLLKCAIQEALSLDHTSASYGTFLMRGMGDIARTDVKFPNPAKDERSSPPHTQDRTGL